MDTLEELGAQLGLSVLKDLTGFSYIEKKIHKVPYSFARAHCLLPLEEKEGVTQVALADPLKLDVLEELRYRIGGPMQEVLAERALLEEAIERCYHQRENEASEVIASLTGQAFCQREEKGEDLLENKASSPIVRMLQVILLEAIQQGASDIHFEPGEKGLYIRYRLDGVLHMRHVPPPEYALQLLTCLKVMAELDIAEKRLPQDGRMRVKVGGKEIDCRVSSIPVSFGERIVVRILDQSQLLLSLDKLGMSRALLESFTQLIQSSEGLVLVTGPTGSGKTTTLYSAISTLDASANNIMTIEDPIEYHLPHIAQMGVHPKIGLDFATGLRHLLRQDPDVILIGEIRDKETAEIALQSSLTGHLVLSTLHTNSSASALTRLVEMGIEPYLLSSSVIGILAQRLVRKLCSFCRVAYIPSSQELSKLGGEKEEASFFRASEEGCPQCYGLGYKGRYPLYELLLMHSPIKRQLLKSADAETLQKKALGLGMRTLREEGRDLIRQGITSTLEVLRATREETF